jgi:hypothetical protein
MGKPSEFLDYAKTCLEVAQRTSSRADRQRLMMLAEAWAALAKEGIDELAKQYCILSDGVDECKPRLN